MTTTASLASDLDFTAPAVDLIDILTDRLVESGVPFDLAADRADQYVMGRLK